MLSNHEVAEVARHCDLSQKVVLRVYHSGGSTRNRERVKLSAQVLGMEPPPEPEDRSELDELDFS